MDPHKHPLVKNLVEGHLPHGSHLPKPKAPVVITRQLRRQGLRLARKGRTLKGL